MRALPATTIKSYNELNRLSWIPVFDNVTSAYAAKSNRLNSTAKNPKIARVPILGGSNADEGRLYSVSANDSSSFVRGLFPTATDQQISDLLAAYPIGGPPGSGVYTGTFTSPLEQLGAFYGDFVFQCPARRVHLETSQVGIPSWRYYYNASFPSECFKPSYCSLFLEKLLTQPFRYGHLPRRRRLPQQRDRHRPGHIPTRQRNSLPGSTVPLRAAHLGELRESSEWVQGVAEGSECHGRVRWWSEGGWTKIGAVYDGVESHTDGFAG